MKEGVKQRILDGMHSIGEAKYLEQYLDTHGHTINWPEDREDDYAILAAVATVFSGIDCDEEIYDLIFEEIKNIKRLLPDSPAFMTRTFRRPTYGAETVQRPFTGPLDPRWADEWHLVSGVDPQAFPELIDRPLPPGSVVRRSPAGRCDLNGRPLKRDAFEVLLRAGYLWAS